MDEQKAAPQSETKDKPAATTAKDVVYRSIWPLARQQRYGDALKGLDSVNFEELRAQDEHCHGTATALKLVLLVNLERWKEAKSLAEATVKAPPKVVRLCLCVSIICHIPGVVCVGQDENEDGDMVLAQWRQHLHVLTKGIEKREFSGVKKHFAKVENKVLQTPQSKFTG